MAFQFASPKAIYVLPRSLGRDKGHFIGRYLNYFTILLVQVPNLLSGGSGQESSDVRKTGHGREFGPWDMRQGSEVQCVNGVANDIYE